MQKAPSPSFLANESPSSCFCASTGLPFAHLPQHEATRQPQGPTGPWEPSRDWQQEGLSAVPAQPGMLPAIPLKARPASQTTQSRHLHQTGLQLQPLGLGSCAQPRVGLTQQKEDGREEALQATTPPNSPVAKGLAPLQETPPRAPALGGAAIAKGPSAGGGRLRIAMGQAKRGARRRRARLRPAGCRARFPGGAWAKGCSHGEASSEGPPGPATLALRQRPPAEAGRAPPAAALAEEPLLGGRSRGAAPPRRASGKTGRRPVEGRGCPRPENAALVLVEVVGNWDGAAPTCSFREASSARARPPLTGSRKGQ